MMLGLVAGEWIFDSVYGFRGCQHQSWQRQRGESPLPWLLYPIKKKKSALSEFLF